MKRNFSFATFSAFLSLFIAVTTANSQTAPNQFQFATDHYCVSKGTTNAVITVQFFPGNRNYQGSVNYSTQGGTAVANSDYTPASGTLNFSGNSYTTIAIPLTPAQIATTNKTIVLSLSTSPNDPDAIITRSNAILQISLPPPPDLAIAPGPNGTVVVSWPDDGTNPLLETSSTSNGSDWTAIGPVPVDGNGNRIYTEVVSSGMAFFRLRRTQ